MEIKKKEIVKTQKNEENLKFDMKVEEQGNVLMYSY